jgi:ABC-type transport system substrate-binding protein
MPTLVAFVRRGLASGLIARLGRARARDGRLVRLAAIILALALPLPTQPEPVAPPSAGAAPKVLRYALANAETGFDPALLNDVASRSIVNNIFEALYAYDPLARPPVIRPRTTTALPEIDNDFRRFTIHIRPGIRFADDPAFKGRPRELVAQDYVYSIERFADPALRSPTWPALEEVGILGLSELRRAALEAHRPFDYDAPVAGLRAVDRFTLQIEVAEPRPRLVQSLVSNFVYGAMAREVVEYYGKDVYAHPVGTNAFRLAQWRRSSLIVLERNPGFRLETYDAGPAADDAEGQAILARFRGRPLPMIDRVEVSIIEHEQPRWLAFLDGDFDFIERLPDAFMDLAMPGGTLAPDLARQGVHAYRTAVPSDVMTIFNMDDPIVGGYAAERVALRRAISLGFDSSREARLVRHGQMIPAQSPVPPNASGYDPRFRSEMGDFDPVRARALLDMYGYLDRDHDGWREQPDGSPLTLVIAIQSDPVSHALAELWRHDMGTLGLRTDFRIAQLPENIKAARAGALMMWETRAILSADGQMALGGLYGPASGGANLARFRLDAFDRIYRRMLVLPDGPERDALFLEAKRIAVAYMPCKVHGHQVFTDMAWPWLVGFRRIQGLDWWRYVDIDESRRSR